MNVADRLMEIHALSTALNRQYFFGVAVQAMRRVPIDHARARCDCARRVIHDSARRFRNLDAECIRDTLPNIRDAAIGRPSRPKGTPRQK